jgi:RNA polymerase sigma-70 factor, ECF subfamily
MAVLTAARSPRKRRTRPAARWRQDPEVRLMLCVRDGDAAAFAELERVYRTRVLGWFCRRLGDRNEAEDLTQEVFLRAIASLGRLRDPDVPYRAYLLKIARNLAIDQWRAHRRRHHLGGSDLPDQADPAPGPEAIAITRDEHVRVLEALDRLPDDYSDVLRLRIVCGHTAAEAGELRGQTANAIRQLQFRAMAALRRELATGTEPEQRNGDER